MTTSVSFALREGLTRTGPSAIWLLIVPAFLSGAVSLQNLKLWLAACFVLGIAWRFIELDPLKKARE